MALAFLSMLALPAPLNAYVIDFDDAPSAIWYWSNTQNGCKLGLMKRTGENRFSPQREITRDEFVTVLGRPYEKSRHLTNEDIEVKDCSYYAKYVK